MRIRLPHPGWLILAVALVAVSAMAGRLWWKLGRVETLVADVSQMAHVVEIKHDAPQWVVQWVEKNHWEQAIAWLKTDVTGLGIYDNATEVDDVWLRRLPQFPNIAFLDLQRTSITDAGLVTVATLPNLKSLDLVYTNVSDAGLPPLKSLKKLECVRLDYTGVTDAGLATLATMPNLNEIYLRKTAITDTGLTKTLKSLAKLEILVLDHTSVSDASLSAIASLPNLRLLSLSETRVTDTGLRFLDKCSALKSVYLNGTKVTREEVQQFRLRHPKVRIDGP